MATKKDPGKFDCYANAENDEPMFVLLARDPDAPNLVIRWVMMRQQRLESQKKLTGEEINKLNDALSIASEMKKWRTRRR